MRTDAATARPMTRTASHVSASGIGLVIQASGVLACCCFAVHLVLLVAGASLVMTLPMLALSGLCVVCAARSWRRPAPFDAVGLLLGAAAMVLVHVTLMHLGIHAGHRAPVHDGMGGMDGMEMGGGAAMQASPLDVLMRLGLGIALLQGVLAATVLTVPRWWRRPRTEEHGREGAT